MLVLTRRKNEKIVIAGDVVVTVVEVRGEKVRLGIAAPRNVTVHREEVHRRIAPPNEPATPRSPEKPSPLRRAAG
ncbi:MAG: carbon storage regulator CsrA [Pirellulales bacterium]